MQGPEPLRSSERSDSPGAGQAPAPGLGSGPGLGSVPGLEGNDPPTVRTGSSMRRVWAGGIGSVNMFPQPGRRIETFVIEEAIGVGGMGAVFRALDTRLDRHVALKLLPPEQAGD